MNIPMVDLKQQYMEIKQEIDTVLLNAVESCQFILGPNVQAFEKEAADYLDVKHCLGVNSGTDALHLSLLAAGVSADDEVITSTFTFIATAEAISYIKAKPVFVDIDSKTCNIDLNQVAESITEKTKAIIPIHLFGQPVNMPILVALCKTKGIKIIEDCAQSFGASIEEKQTGSFGDAGAFSFFPSKNLGCYGDGGLISTNSDTLFEQASILRNHGMNVRYHHTKTGFNSRLDELQAAILRVKLQYIDQYNNNRRKISAQYQNLLSGTDIILPHQDNIGQHVYHQYTCAHPRRDVIIEALNKKGIASAIYYPIPLHKQEVYSSQYNNIELPNAEHIASQCFSLPIYPELESEKIHIICNTIYSAL